MTQHIIDEIHTFLASLDRVASMRDDAAFAELFVDGPDTLLAIQGEIIEGRTSIQVVHRDAWAGLQKLLFRTTPRSIVHLDDDTVLATCLGDSDRTTIEGTRIQRGYAVSFLMVRRPEGWRIRQAHESLATPSQHG